MSAKPFQPTFTTRDGKRVSFGARTTNDVAAKKRAGLTKAGLPPTGSGGYTYIEEPPRTPNRWPVLAIAGASFTGIVWAALAQLFGRGMAAVLTAVAAYLVYRLARRVAHELAYWSLKLRQIRGPRRAVEQQAPREIYVPKDTVNDPGRPDAEDPKTTSDSEV